jgi:hypothetical protein
VILRFVTVVVGGDFVKWGRNGLVGGGGGGGLFFFNRFFGGGSKKGSLTKASLSRLVDKGAGTAHAHFDLSYESAARVCVPHMLS